MSDLCVRGRPEVSRVPQDLCRGWSDPCCDPAFECDLSWCVSFGAAMRLAFAPEVWRRCLFVVYKNTTFKRDSRPRAPTHGG